MRVVNNAFCIFSDDCLNDNDCRHCVYGKMLANAYLKGRADKYREITSEYMLLTEKQMEEIITDTIEKVVTNAFKWLMKMDIIDCDGCDYPSECVNRNMSCFEVMAEHYLEQLKENKNE